MRIFVGVSFLSPSFLGISLFKGNMHFNIFPVQLFFPLKFESHSPPVVTKEHFRDAQPALAMQGDPVQ